MSKPSPAHVWHDEVMQRDGYRCAAERHDKRCRGRAEIAHHIVYRSHLVTSAFWLVENGIALADICHTLAHRTHNQTIAERRLVVAVDAVNKIQGHLPGQKRPYFYSKGLSNV